MNDKHLNDFLSKQGHFVLAVTLDDGTPWATPVTIKRWEGREFEWDSHLQTLHSQAIAKNPDVSIVLFNKPGEEFGQYGFYAKGAAELVQARDDGFGRYRVTIAQAWVNDETHMKHEVNLGE